MESGQASKVDDVYSRPTSWVQSILQQEDEHSKDEAVAYPRIVTSYFEPISLDEAAQLPPINDIHRKTEDYRGGRVGPPAPAPAPAPPSAYHHTSDTHNESSLPPEPVGYTANWSTY